MIKAIKVTNHLGESIRLELANPEKSGFIVKRIDGLGPAKANVNMTELATNDGAVDNSARLQTRNIVLQLGFLGKPMIEDTRLDSYRFFPIKRNITLTIETDRRTCETVGRVESNEPDIFSEEEGCQISIICPDPYFYSKDQNETIFNGIDSLFEFAFDNDSLDENLIEFGNIIVNTEGTVKYEGDAEIGITIKMHMIGPVEGINIYSLKTREQMSINDEKLEAILGSKIQSGDEIIIKTSKGQKSITLMRSGIVYNILNALNRPIKWFQISKGDNIFVYTVEKGLSFVNFSIFNDVVYEGV